MSCRTVSSGERLCYLLLVPIETGTGIGPASRSNVYCMPYTSPCAPDHHPTCVRANIILIHITHDTHFHTHLQLLQEEARYVQKSEEIDVLRRQKLELDSALLERWGLRGSCEQLCIHKHIQFSCSEHQYQYQYQYQYRHIHKYIYIYTITYTDSNTTYTYTYISTLIYKRIHKHKH